MVCEDLRAVLKYESKEMKYLRNITDMIDVVSKYRIFQQGTIEAFSRKYSHIMIEDS